MIVVQFDFNNKALDGKFNSIFDKVNLTLCSNVQQEFE